jgi:hypothetical protein
MALIKRNRAAMDIQAGACNPSGIAIAIVDACREMRDAPGGAGTDQITSDPAIRMMVHQLAFICAAARIDHSPGEYRRLDAAIRSGAATDGARHRCRVLTHDQRAALKSVYDRGATSNPDSYLAFRRSASLDSLAECVMVPWAGMWLGIELDGHIHS